MRAVERLKRDLVSIGRIAADCPTHLGKHKRHGMNVQVNADPCGRLLWASPALPGAVHNLRAAHKRDLAGARRATSRTGPRRATEVWQRNPSPSQAPALDH
jgi:hypothetical protein